MKSQLLSKQQELSANAAEDDVRQYLKEIHVFPRLTPEEERVLARRCADGDEEAIRSMVNSNLRLVVSVAREYAGRGVPLLDLIQEGSIGLLTAARKFDYTLDFRFSTYATKWIRQGIGRCIENHGLIRVPVYTGQMIRKVNNISRSLQQEYGAEPTAEQIAERCDISKEKVSQLLQLAPNICSLDAPARDEDTTLQALLEDNQTPQPYEELVREELNHTIDTLLSQLNERQAQVLRLRFGMDDGVCYSQEAIGVKLGVSKERARQIERQAMDKLKELGSTMGLEDFLE